MTIPQIKARLTMAQVLRHYHLKPDKKIRLNCPFHDDKTPSMQVYYKTHTAYCFSGNCPTHGKSLDVIDFVMHKEGCTKAEAIERCKAMAGGEVTPEVATAVKAKPMTELPRSAVLHKVFTYYANAVSMTKSAQAYLTSRGLDYKLLTARGLSVGYNSGQMHHGTRRDEYLIRSCIEIGLMSEFTGGRKSRTGGQQYRVFGNKCLAFALRGADAKIEGLYFRSTAGGESKAARHYYLRDRRGLYPKHPAANAKRLLITESIIDAVSLLHNEATTEGWEVLAMYGTNGFTKEHVEAVTVLDELAEVCLFLNGDVAGRKATGAVAQKIREVKPGVLISTVAVQEGEDCNSLLVKEGPELLAHLIEERETIEREAEPSSSVDPATALRTGSAQREEPTAPAASAVLEVTMLPAAIIGKLDVANAYDLGYRAQASELRVKGLRIEQLDTLKVTLQIRVA